MVCMFWLTLLLLYKIGQVHMLATKTVGSCVCGHVMSFDSICNMYTLVFLVSCAILLVRSFDTVVEFDSVCC